jgi:hypothetical protein
VPDYWKEPEVTTDVGHDLLRERFESYIVDHYIGLHNTVVSVVLAVAGLAAASLAGSHTQYGGSYPLLWMLWLASLLLCVTVFAGTMSGSVVMPPLMPAITDLLIPLLLGIGESVLFGVLAHQVSGLNKAPSVAEAWFIALTVVCACAAAAITRAMQLFGDATYPEEISGPIDDYRLRRLPADRKGTLALAMIGTGGAIASETRVTWLEYLLAGCVLLGFLLALRAHARSAVILRTAVQQARRVSVSRSNSAEATRNQETGTGWPA